MSSDDEVTWTHTVPAAEAESLMVLACRCGILHTMKVGDAGVARIDCPCGVVATLPSPACGVGYPNKETEKQ